MTGSYVGAGISLLLAAVSFGAPGCGKSDPAPAGDMKTAQMKAAGVMLEHAVKATTTFYMETKKAPKSIQELVASRKLHIQKSADPWGQELSLVPLEGKPGVEVCSSGPDMAPGTDDDLCKQVPF